MEAPEGAGWWIWYLDKALAGRTYEQFAAVCQANNISHVHIKCGDGGNIWGQIEPAVKPLQQAGLWVGAWQYCYGDDPEGEARAGIAALNTGCQGLTLDLEKEAEGKHDNLRRMWELLRETRPDAWIAVAPLPVIDYHDPDLYRISAQYASAWQPQFYSQALGPHWGDADRLIGLWDRWLGVWESEGLPRLPLMPIAQAYGTSTPEQIREFARRCRAEGYPAMSWWEWAQASEEQWQAAMAAAREWAPTEPPAPAPEPSLADLLGALWGRSEVIDEHATEVEAEIADMEQYTTHLRSLAAELHAEAQAVRDYVVQLKQALDLE